MTREVLISIKGLHGVREDGGANPNETSHMKNEKRCRVEMPPPFGRRQVAPSIERNASHLDGADENGSEEDAVEAAGASADAPARTLAVSENRSAVDGDAVEVFSAGQYYFRNGKHYVEYMEPAEVPGIEDGKKKSRITLRGKHLEILQRGSGSATTRLVFEENTKNTCWYPTPVGNVLASFDVGEVQVTESDDLIEILVDYALELNYEYVADSRIQIQIMAKDSGLFHLT